ncbi:hypothetical protein Ciccas_009862 [Cichlidogyrus casuarinus]|uniref:Galectin domain-containing protein n=1 Tax=Cichlidogyrus casuarinus TaxID=1844966 RepID=A0ABD2Q0B5_9PLAT
MYAEPRNDDEIEEGNAVSLELVLMTGGPWKTRTEDELGREFKKNGFAQHGLQVDHGFSIRIIARDKGYVVILNGAEICQIPYLISLESVSYLVIEGDAEFSMVEFDDCKSPAMSEAQTSDLEGDKFQSPMETNGKDNFVPIPVVNPKYEHSEFKFDSKQSLFSIIMPAELNNVASPIKMDQAPVVRAAIDHDDKDNFTVNPMAYTSAGTLPNAPTVDGNVTLKKKNKNFAFLKSKKSPKAESRDETLSDSEVPNQKVKKSNTKSFGLGKRKLKDSVNGASMPDNLHEVENDLKIPKIKAGSHPGQIASQMHTMQPGLQDPESCILPAAILPSAHMDLMRPNFDEDSKPLTKKTKKPSFSFGKKNKQPNDFQAPVTASKTLPIMPEYNDSDLEVHISIRQY